MAKLKIESYEDNFDELYLAKHYFAFDDITSSTIKSFLRNSGAVVDYLSLVSKYLLNAKLYDNDDKRSKFQNPTFVRKLLWKYFVIVIYKYVTSSKSFVKNEFYNEKLDIFNDHIDLVDLLDFNFDDDSFISKLYKQEANDLSVEDRKIIIECGFSDKKQKIQEKEVESIRNMLKMNYNYFTSRLKMSEYLLYENLSNLDLIVCRTLTNVDFNKFTFQFYDDIDIIKQNFENIDNKQSQFKKYTIFIGYLIDNIIRNNKYEKIEKPKNTTTNLRIISKDFALKDINFVEIDDNNFININFEKLVPFTFLYNKEFYIFDKEGIRKKKTGIR